MTQYQYFHFELVEGMTIKYLLSIILNCLLLLFKFYIIIVIIIILCMNCKVSLIGPLIRRRWVECVTSGLYLRLRIQGFKSTLSPVNVLKTECRIL